MYKVFIRKDNRHRVLEIQSSAFLEDVSEWIQVDEGEGVRFHHAQGNYFQQPIITDEGVPRYKLVGGKVKERTAEEIQADIDAIPPPPPTLSELNDMRFAALKPIISDLLKDREATVVLGLREFILDWKPGAHERGRSVMWDGYPYKVVQTHDSTENPNWTPGIYHAGFAPWHGTTPETALPWIMPRHAEENYLPGEYMMYDDGLIYLSQRSTNFTPEDVPTDWWVQYENGEFGPIDGANEEEPVDPEIPADKNSNGTDAWSEWVPWNYYNETLYQIGDRVTKDGVRYIATLGNNHYDPVSGTGWTVAPE